jgi:hypothetical protein
METEMKVKTIIDCHDKEISGFDIPEGSVLYDVIEKIHTYEGMWTSRYGTYKVSVPKDCAILLEPTDEEYNKRIREIIRQGSKDSDKRIYIPKAKKKDILHPMPTLPMCKFDVAEYEKSGYPSPFTPQDRFVFLGEIKGQSGHCVVANVTTGKIEVGWHTELFIELTEEEL